MTYKHIKITRIPVPMAKVLSDLTYEAEVQHEQRVANTAPDLLELARQVVLAADQNEGDIPADIVSGARAAIAKATGEAR